MIDETLTYYSAYCSERASIKPLKNEIRRMFICVYIYPNHGPLLKTEFWESRKIT
jgi:hypothetical protein